MARSSLTDRSKIYGTFIANFLNCRLEPTTISALVKKCLHIMKHHLGYSNPQWDDFQVKSTFGDLVSKTEGGFFKFLMAKYASYSALGGYHPYKNRIFSERRLSVLDMLRRSITEQSTYSWGHQNEKLRPMLTFYVKLALLRKNFRRISNRIIDGENLEAIRKDIFLGDFLLGIESEYRDFSQHITISNNQFLVADIMHDPPNVGSSQDDDPVFFINAYLFSCLSYCFVQFLSETNNVSRIGKCHNPSCSRYFLKLSLRERKFCCRACNDDYKNQSKDPGQWKRYMQTYRRSKRDSDKKVQFEAEVERIIKAGFSRSEAEELARDNLEM
ncbi:MAG: hypothetical protein ABIF87_06930 [Pseudomonadota bacterium]